MTSAVRQEILVFPGSPGGAIRFRAPSPPADQAKAAVAKLGFDVAALERTRTSRFAELRTAAERYSRTAVADSEASAAKLAAVLQTQAAGWVHLSDPVAAPSSGYFNVDMPSRIFAVGDLPIDATGLTSFNSFAKVRRPNTEGFAHQELVFVFPWPNTTSVDQVISVNAVVGVNGVVSAGDAGGWTVFGHDHNTLSVQTLLRVFGDTDDNEAFGLQADQAAIVNIDAYEDSWPQSVGAIVSQMVTRGVALGATDLLVKAGATRIFHVAVTFDASAPGGDAGFDFSSGAFKISGFGMFVHVTS
jgi:hypothetical protein